MPVPSSLAIISSERIDGTEIVVEFSDGTMARYTTQDLADLRPQRDLAENGQTNSADTAN